MLLLAPRIATAAPLIVEIDPLFHSGAPGDTLIFTGQITNLTGVTLNASDLFLDFSGFDPSLTPTQLLGVPDFVLPDHRISPVVDLFSVMLAATAQPGVTYPMDIFVQDVNGNVSDSVTVNAIVTGTSVGEPETAFLLLAGLLSAWMVRVRRDRHLSVIS